MLENKIKEHLEAVSNLDKDVQDIRNKALRNAHIVSWVFGGCFVLAAVAMIMVVWRFKQPEVVVFRVDNATGKVERIYSAIGIQETYSEVVDKYWLAKYIEYRESYSWAFGKQFYEYVGYMSESEEQARYSRYMSKDNSASPINEYKETGYVRVHITNHSKINDQTYIVDFI
jgi:type IV secretion system protein VirB8